MSVVIKYKLSDVAKDLNVQNKELIDFLYQTLGESKKHTSPLTEAELNHVFEHYTQKNSEASLDAYLASAPAPKVAEKDILKKAATTVPSAVFRISFSATVGAGALARYASRRASEFFCV